MTTQEVFDRHLHHQLEGDLDAILSDYAPDAVAATPEGIGSGHDYIRKVYEQVLPLIGSMELTPSVHLQGEVIYLTFRGHRDGKDELLGTDTFVIRDGLIQTHTFYAHPTSPTPDDRS
jgi:SnoaL-like domain